MMKKIAVAGVVASPVLANAATDIAGVMTDVGGYQTTAMVIGVAVLLFVLGRKIVKKLV